MANEPDRDELNRRDPAPAEDIRGLEDEDEREDEDGDLEDETDKDESTA